MALVSVRNDLHQPQISTTFVLPVAGSTALDNNTNAQHLPGSLMLIVSGTGTFIWKDAFGTTNTTTFPTGVFMLPFTASTVEVGTAAGSLTVSWQVTP